jgi:hypothetical protein
VPKELLVLKVHRELLVLKVHKDLPEKDMQVHQATLPQ